MATRDGAVLLQQQGKGARCPGLTEGIAPGQVRVRPTGETPSRRQPANREGRRRRPGAGVHRRPIPPGGTGKDARWIDIHEDDLDEAQMATWVKQAAALPGWDPGRPS